MEGEGTPVRTAWADLLIRSREGDEQAFEDLVRACERRVLTIAYQVTGNLQDAQDVAQEAFLRLYRSRDRFQEDRSFEAWLYRIVVNQAKRVLARRLRRRAAPLDEAMADNLPAEGGSPEPSNGTEVADLVLPLLDKLPPRLRAVFVLRDLQGLDTRAISQILGCTETTVRRHSADARTRVRTMLRKRHPREFAP